MVELLAFFLVIPERIEPEREESYDVEDEHRILIERLLMILISLFDLRT